MAKKLRNSLLALLLVMALVCAAVVTVLFARHTTARADVSEWDGNLIAAGWGGEQYVDQVDKGAYVIKWVNPEDIVDGELDSNADPKDDYEDGLVAYITIGDAKALAYFAHEVNVDTANNLDDSYVKLTADIDLKHKMWIPIGQTDRQNKLGKGQAQSRFSGTFDAGYKVDGITKNHVIYNLDTTEYVANLKKDNGYYIAYDSVKIPFKARGDEEYSYGLFASAYNVTVKNLNIEGVKIELGDLKVDGESTSFVSDSIAAIIGYCTGNVTVENCTVGSTNPDLDNTIKVSDGDGGVAGIVGRLYAYDGNASSNTNIKLINCVNYLNIEGSAKRRVAGIAGFLNYSLKCTVENCVNYGNITGGGNTGGIVGGWTPNKGNDKVITDSQIYCTLIDCDNFGTIYSGGATYLGGITGYFYRNTGGIRFTADGCVNYGNVGGGNGNIGGLFATVCPDGSWSPRYTVITNNYNYGDVYSYGAAHVGGYVGYNREPGNNGGNAYDIAVSGGNLGTIYGVPETNNQNFGVGSASISKQIFLVAAGGIVPEFDTGEGVPASKYTEPVYKRYTDDAVIRRVNQDGYVYTDNFEFVYDYKYTDDTFAYADAEHTTIIGIKNGVAIPATIEIPESVITIGVSAFAGHPEITAIDWADSSVSEIALAAFMGSGLKSLELPASIETIGANAFAGCKNLNHVQLSAGAENIVLDKAVFAGTRVSTAGDVQGAYIIATGSSQYGKLVANDSFAGSGGVLTYEVTILYYYDGVQLKISDTVYTETKLHGQSYQIEKKSGLWGDIDENIKIVGPDSQYVWYYGTDASPIGLVSNMTDLLRTVNADTIRLDAYNSEDGRKVFIVRDDIVYDAATTITTDDYAAINGLLASVGDRLTGTETVKFYDSEGSEVDSISGAGTYTIEVKPADSTAVYTFTVVIAPAPLNLADTKNLEWFITRIGEDELTADKYVSLTPDEVTRARTLYIYTYLEDDSKEYPAWDTLSDEQIKELKLNKEYITRNVLLSVVRNRNAEVTIKVVVNGQLYEGTYTANTGSEVGKYTAEITLVPDANHVFTVGNIDSTRGMSIVIDETDGTATVKKDWYILDYGNWLIDRTTGEDYSILGHTFGQSPNFTFPKTHYEGAGGVITMQMYYNNSNEPIQHADYGSEINSGNYPQFINSVMPAGEYRLEINAEGVTYEDEDNVKIYVNGFTEVYTFTVTRAEITTLERAQAVISALTGKFEFDAKDDTTSFYSVSAAEAISLFVGFRYGRTVAGVWSNTAYNDYYDNYAITFNLLRWYSDTYRPFDGDTAGVDEYTVYYKLEGNNFYSNIDNNSRYDYSFKVLRYRTLTAPEVGNVEYTGNNVLPSIVDTSGYSDKYEVIWGDAEYVSGGTHHVTLKLNDNYLYRWSGVKGDEITLDFEIEKAENTFTVLLNLVGWNYSSFDATINNIRAAVKFLDKGSNIVFSVSKKGESKAISGLESFTIDEKGKVSSDVAAKLNALSSGSYILSATVAESGNYKVLTGSTEFTVGKAFNSWKDGEGDLVLPNWVEGKYNEEDNPIQVNAAHGNVKYRIEDLEGTIVYYISTDTEADLVTALNGMKVGTYLLVAWVDGDDNFTALAERTFRIQIFEKPGLPWWVTLIVAVGSLAIAALIIFILWKKGVFRVITDKILIAIRTRVSVEATIASVRAAKMAEEGKKSVADAKRKERLEAAREKQRSMTPEERAAQLEAKAQADVARAEKLRAQSEANLAKAEKMRKSAPAEEKGEATSDAQSEAAATENPETPTEE